MLNNSVENQISQAYRLTEKLKEKGLLNKPFRAKDIEHMGGTEITCLEQYGFVECVSRETEKVQIPISRKRYYVVDNFGNKTQNLENLSNYQTYKLISEQDTKTVDNNYKVYRLKMSYETFIEHLEDLVLKEIKRIVYYAQNRG